MDMLKRNLRPPTVVAFPMLAFALIAFMIAIALSIFAYREQDQANALNNRSEQLILAQAKRPVPKLSRTAQDEKKRWEALKAERDFAWGGLFSALEKAANANIELLEVSPDKSSRRVLLRGEARDRDALVAYLGTLAAQPALRNVHLTHQSKMTRERLETWSFEIKATMSD